MRISDWSSDVCFFRSTSVTERVRRLLEQDPGRSSSRDIAALLDVSTSTMKRRLEDEGTTFRQVRQSLLRERAIERKSGEEGPSVAVRVEHGGRRRLNTKQT